MDTFYIDKEKFNIKYDAPEFTIVREKTGDEFIMTTEELQNLQIDHKDFYMIVNNKITSHPLESIVINRVEDKELVFQGTFNKEQLNFTFSMPLSDFCIDIFSLYLKSKKPKTPYIINEDLPHFKQAFDNWKTTTTKGVLNCKAILINGNNNGELVAVGYFEEDKLKVIVQDDLSFYESLILRIPYNKYEVTLKEIEKINKHCYIYALDSIKHINNSTIDPDIQEKLNTTDLKEVMDYEGICDLFGISKILRSASKLDNFFDI